jgi:uncharacterized membrane protein
MQSVLFLIIVQYPLGSTYKKKDNKMIRIVCGLILIVLGVLVSTAKQRSPGESDSQMITMSIFFMFIPGVFLIKSGIVSIFDEQKEKRKKEEELLRKKELEQKAKQIANCNHSYSPWSMSSVDSYYCGNYQVFKEGERSCIICGKIETCRRHNINEVGSEGSIYDRTVYYRCATCGYEFSVGYNI